MKSFCVNRLELWYSDQHDLKKENLLFSRILERMISTCQKLPALAAR